MTWEIALGIFALIAGVASIAKPVINLTNSITKLTIQVEDFYTYLEEYKETSEQLHKKLEKDVADNSRTLMKHESRISILERKG
nr:MAG TPA: hypothetical protein [Caudoviricetes sp.]